MSRLALNRITQLIESVCQMIRDVCKIRTNSAKDCYSIAGGCHPLMTQRERAATMTALFIRNCAIVARPTDVRPSTRVASRLHLKCSDHCCIRGLNSGTTSPVSES